VDVDDLLKRIPHISERIIYLVVDLRSNDPELIGDVVALWILGQHHVIGFHRQLLAGNGVQICIYALALRDDFEAICVSLLARNAELEPQAALGEITLENEFWKEIARMQQTGIFGMLGEIRSEFAFTGTYPLATLSIDKFLLLDKWQRTHPAFAKADKK